MAEGGRSWRTWQMAVVAAIALVIGILAGSASTEDETTVAAGQVTTTEAGEQAPTATKAPVTTVSALPPTTAAPTTSTTTGPKTTFGDGNYRVGIDIAAGTYRSNGTATNCYWQRLSNFTGTDNIIANYLSNSPTTVTILASDVGFETRRCGTWSKV